jgi:hypothetical protein
VIPTLCLSHFHFGNQAISLVGEFCFDCQEEEEEFPNYNKKGIAKLRTNEKEAIRRCLFSFWDTNRPRLKKIRENSCLSQCCLMNLKMQFIRDQTSSKCQIQRLQKFQRDTWYHITSSAIGTHPRNGTME